MSILARFLWLLPLLFSATSYGLEDTRYYVFMLYQPLDKTESWDLPLRMAGKVAPGGHYRFQLVVRSMIHRQEGEFQYSFAVRGEFSVSRERTITDRRNLEDEHFIEPPEGSLWHVNADWRRVRKTHLAPLYRKVLGDTTAQPDPKLLAFLADGEAWRYQWGEEKQTYTLYRLHRITANDLQERHAIESVAWFLNPETLPPSLSVATLLEQVNKYPQKRGFAGAGYLGRANRDHQAFYVDFVRWLEFEGLIARFGAQSERDLARQALQQTRAAQQASARVAEQLETIQAQGRQAVDSQAATDATAQHHVAVLQQKIQRLSTEVVSKQQQIRGLHEQTWQALRQTDLTAAGLAAVEAERLLAEIGSTVTQAQETLQALIEWEPPSAPAANPARPSAGFGGLYYWLSGGFLLLIFIGLFTKSMQVWRQRSRQQQMEALKRDLRVDLQNDSRRELANLQNQVRRLARTLEHPSAETAEAIETLDGGQAKLQKSLGDVQRRIIALETALLEAAKRHQADNARLQALETALQSQLESQVNQYLEAAWQSPRVRKVLMENFADLTARLQSAEAAAVANLQAKAAEMAQSVLHSPAFQAALHASVQEAQAVAVPTITPQAISPQVAALGKICLQLRLVDAARLEQLSSHTSLCEFIGAVVRAAKANLPADLYLRLAAALQEQGDGQVQLIIPRPGDTIDTREQEIVEQQVRGKGMVDVVASLVHPGVRCDGEVVYKAEVIEGV